MKPKPTSEELHGYLLGPSEKANRIQAHSRTRRVGNVAIRFKHAGPKTLVGAGTKTGAVFQALRYLGKDRADRSALKTIARSLTAEELSDLCAQSLKVQGWIRPLVKEMQQIGPN